MLALVYSSSTQSSLHFLFSQQKYIAFVCLFWSQLVWMCNLQGCCTGLDYLLIFTAFGLNMRSCFSGLYLISWFFDLFTFQDTVLTKKKKHLFGLLQICVFSVSDILLNQKGSFEGHLSTVHSFVSDLCNIYFRAVRVRLDQGCWTLNVDLIAPVVIFV